MTTPPDGQVARELERLCGALDRFGRDLSEIKTSCAVLVERSDRTEEDVRQLREDTDRKIAALRGELEEFKRGRWPLPSIGALSGVAGAVVAVIALVR